MRPYLTLLLFASPLLAQSNRYTIDQVRVSNSYERPVQGTNTTEIVIDVTFRLRAAKDVVRTENDQDMVVIKEEGKEVYRIPLQKVRSRELTTMMAMDVSGSMGRKSIDSPLTKMQEAQAAAKLFLERLPPKADAGLLLFDHRIKPGLLEPCGDPDRVTDHRKRLTALIDGAQPDGGTAYLDATHQALSLLKKYLAGDKAVVLMTDGIDLNSTKNARKVIDYANAVRIPVYVLGVGDAGWGEPVSSVLVLDHSGSMTAKAGADNKTKMEALHDAASRFVDLMRPGAQATLLPFSSEVEVPGPFSEDKGLLKDRIRRLRPEGGTSLFDATHAGIETVVATRPKGKRYVIALTDGVDEDPGSRHGPDEVIALAKAENVPLYMLGLGRKEDINEDVMRRMASETGGRYERADNQDELYKIFEKLSTDLHGDGIDEEALKELATKTGGRYYRARDASQLKLLFTELADDLEKTHTVTFRSLRQRMDALPSGIDLVVVDREGKAVSEIIERDSFRSGLVVAEKHYLVYLILLAILLGLLWLPSALKRVST